MPLGYVACRRLGLERPWAFGVAMVAALVPAALFYSQYAMTDAIYPVLVLAWLLAVHSWLTARSARGQYVAAIVSALLAGYSYAVHSRGAVMVAGYAVVGIVIAWRRFVPRRTAAAAAVALCLPLGAGHLLNRHLSSVMYPRGPRTLAGEALIRLRTVHGVIFVLEMAAGQLWRFVLDGWGVSGLGLAAAIFVIFRRSARDEVRIMAGLAAGVTLVTAVTSPAALPPTQPQAWASGRYLDGLVVVFFLVGSAVLLRASPRRLRLYAACVAPPTLLAAIVVFAYTGGSVPTSGFGAAFVFAEPAVLTQDWTTASVLLATLAAFVLLGAAVGLVLLGSRLGDPWASRVRTVVLAGLGVVSLVASLQMTSHISQASTPGQERHHDRPRDRDRAEAGRSTSPSASACPGRPGCRRRTRSGGRRCSSSRPAPVPAGRRDRGRGGLVGRAARGGQLAAAPRPGGGSYSPTGPTSGSPGAGPEDDRGGGPVRARRGQPRRDRAVHGVRARGVPGSLRVAALA